MPTPIKKLSRQKRYAISVDGEPLATADAHDPEQAARKALCTPHRPRVTLTRVREREYEDGGRRISVRLVGTLNANW